MLTRSTNWGNYGLVTIVGFQIKTSIIVFYIVYKCLFGSEFLTHSNEVLRVRIVIIISCDTIQILDLIRTFQVKTPLYIAVIFSMLVYYDGL